MTSKCGAGRWGSALVLLSSALTVVCASTESLSHQHLHLHQRATNSTWQPPVGATWQILLSVVVTEPYPNVQVFDFDLFDNPKSTIESLHASNIKAICYFSAGSYENWRPDASEFQTSDYGNPLEGWPGEYWLNTSSANVRSIMSKRLDLAVSKGCDGVDPDNTDGYNNDNGLGLTQDTAVDYVSFLADEAHSRGLSIGLKNTGEIIPRVIDKMEYAVNEQCVRYDECDLSRPFINEGKPVFEIEYPNSAPHVSSAKENQICTDPQRAQFSTLLKELSLNAWSYACPLDTSTNSGTNATSSGTPSAAGRTSSSWELLCGFTILSILAGWTVG